MDYLIRKPNLRGAIEKIEEILNASALRNQLKLYQRGNEPVDMNLTEEHRHIPDGNFYLVNNDTKNESIDVINLFINGNYQIALKGMYPLFMVHSMINRHQKTNPNEILTLTIESVLAMAIIDRINMIADKRNNGVARGFLIRRDIKEVLKYVSQEKSFTPNNFKKIANRVVYVPLNKTSDGTLINGGSWQYDDQDNNSNVFADSFKQNVPIDEFNEFVDDNNIVLGENSEQSQMKGTWVMFTPGLDNAKQKLDDFRLAPVANDGGYCYRSNCLYMDDNGHMVNIYGNSQKVYARVKSLISADRAPFIDNNIDKLDYNEQPVFNRSKSYLHFDDNKMNQHDELRKDTTYNILVVFKEGSREVLTHLNPEGKDVEDFTREEIDDVCNYFAMEGAGPEKEMLSRAAHMADCHFTISQELASQLITLQRTIDLDCNNDNLTPEFQGVIEQFRKTGRAIEIKEESMDRPVGFTHRCPECEHLMSPAEESDGDYVIKAYATESQTTWRCKSCDHILLNGENIEGITMRKKFKSAKKIRIVNITESVDEEGLALQSEIYLPINIARAISDEGLKGMCRPTSDAFQGYISGTAINPITNEPEELTPIKIDAIVPYGAFKGKESGMTLALNRFFNAVYGTTINPEPAVKTGNIEMYEQSINHWYKNADISWTRHELVNDGDNIRVKELSTSTKDGLRFGIIEMGITESNEEFTKMDTDLYPMKVSPMNSLYYRTLGFNKLADLLKENSFTSISNSEHKVYLEHLLRAQMYSPAEDYTRIEASELARAFEIPFTNVMSYDKWKRVLMNHDFFNNSKMEKGFYVPVNVNGIEVPICFPPRDVMKQLVAVNKFSNRIRLRSSFRKMFEVFSMLTRDVSQVKLHNLNSYSEEIAKEFDGKRGLFAQSATYMYPGIKAKKTSDGFIPTGTVVADMPGMWHYIHRNSEYSDMEYDDFITAVSLPEDHEDSITIYGMIQRDPYIWYLQAVNAVKIWHPHRANRHFKYKYDTSFFNIYPQFNRGGIGGIVTNTLDGLFFFQDDSDGDLTRILLPLKGEIQSELAGINEAMDNYEMLFNPDYGYLHQCYEMNKWWHIKYVIDEITGNTNAKFINKDGYRLEAKGISVKDRNLAVINATQAKFAIGPTTVSQWQIQEIAGLMTRVGDDDNELATQCITYEEMLDACGLYQKALTQDGTIRSVKHVSGELNKLTLDNMAINTMTVSSTFGETKGQMISPRNKMYELAELYLSKYEAGRTLNHIAEFWHNNAKVDGNSISTAKATDIAKIIRAFGKVTHGSKGGFSRNDNFLKYLIHPQAKYLFSYETHKELIDMIKQIYTPVYDNINKIS
jgi:hypothetical protein